MTLSINVFLLSELDTGDISIVFNFVKLFAYKKMKEIWFFPPTNITKQIFLISCKDMAGH